MVASIVVLPLQSLRLPSAPHVDTVDAIRRGVVTTAGRCGSSNSFTPALARHDAAGQSGGGAGGLAPRRDDDACHPPRPFRTHRRHTTRSFRAMR